ncbi:hypothetical protein Cus16_2092 [Curtobacterium sp. ER1/6]|nr:hypothetical protein Cus16_2092 [Curtobacterium sp. ER1/6]
MRVRTAPPVRRPLALPGLVGSAGQRRRRLLSSPPNTSAAAMTNTISWTGWKPSRSMGCSFRVRGRPRVPRRTVR